MSDRTSSQGDKRSKYYSSSSSCSSTDESDDQSNNKQHQSHSLSRMKSLSHDREIIEEKSEGSKVRDDKYISRENSSKNRDKANYEFEYKKKYTEPRRGRNRDREKRHHSRSRDSRRRSRSRSRSYRSHSRRKSCSRSRSHRSRSRSRSHSYTRHGPRSNRHYRHRSRRRSRSRSYDRSRSHRHFDKSANKLSVLEKLGIELKVPEGMDKNQLDGKAATDISFPSYYNPSNVNPLKYMQQMQKRKLIWGNKAKQEGQNPDEKKEEEGVTTKAPGDLTNVWQTAKFSQDQDGKLTAKFKRLMGIKDGETTSTVSTGESNSELIKKQEEMFSSMEKQYEVARVATHTHRGVGLGFGVHQYPR